MNKKLHIIGGGLAGSEAAWQAANAGIAVTLYEMRPMRGTDAHISEWLGELVCSNSFRSDDAQTNAVGLCHAELRDMDSLIMKAADAHKLPAGTALAVDREGFAQTITKHITAHPNITLHRQEVEAIPDDGAPVIIATGPLTSPALSAAIAVHVGDKLAFFDAIAPILYHDSIDMDICWWQSRYDKGKDYINCPMDETQYNDFIDALLAGDKTDFKEWEEDTPYFNGCLPIEVMAARGRETLRHGPMKPRGLTNEHAPTIKPYGVVQLRQDNALGTLFNMVGFQTKLKHGSQTQIFKTIPGLADARFARLGGLHRNTFLNSPSLLDRFLRLKSAPHIRFAGQITGVEGYVESTAIGLMAGKFAAYELAGQTPTLPPATTAFGALLAHITGDGDASTFQPMNINFGLMPPLKTITKYITEKKRGVKKQNRKLTLTNRARKDFADWQTTLPL
ncbi:MAG: methylenetetrahydrofolate--tRNA-(uracil(54)-C(5))-methyltransferase (FADH(2)-oxidizing) TrmFO [Alphaproteobacteria bacterium]|nr:methylenetetrahydrofolate--tRNA-(uracil(54)-C(5))-methyltransferase (FADH(2)-oxidizing) TrmFO [Alphaproteobacteria bacterium]MBE8220685.1 methylenetetrahydrofolate--tRNA-(uracil(54)-C(5))-methyltransferase (FADH(2)-oxidizing) TrmFO [Alphaproteobacteria bacterium]